MFGHRLRAAAMLPLAAVLAAAGCAGDGESRGASQRGELIPLVSVHATTRSCFAERGERVVRTQAEWSDLWGELHCRDAPALPVVDFSNDMLLVVHDLPGPSGCYHVRVGEVRARGRGMQAVVHRHVPEPRQICTMAIVHPAHVVRLPARPGAIAFEWRTVSGPAPPEQ